MSIVRYNGITLPYAFATQFHQDAVYDDVSGTDRCYTRFDIHVQCIVNADYMPMLAAELLDNGVAVTTNPADIMDAVRTTLLRPRQTLSYLVNGVDLIPPKQGTNVGFVDAKNGPTPMRCVISEVTNTTFVVSFHVVAHYWENTVVDPEGVPIADNFNSNDVLFNRWSETVTLDNCMMSRRTREGKFVIRSDNKSGMIVDQFRSQMAVLSIPLGFLRESAKYTVTPDGLGLAYTITDVENFKPPPAPAFEADGDFYMTSTNNGAVRFGECRVRLKGAKTTKQDELIKTAIIVAYTKMVINGAAVNDQGALKLLKFSGVRIGMWENTVEVVVRGMLKARKERFKGSTLIGGLNTKVPLVDPDANPGGGQADSGPNYIPPYTDRGTARLLLRAAAYYDPNINLPDLNLASQIAPNNDSYNPKTKGGSQRTQLVGGNNMEVGEAGRRQEVDT